MTIKTALVKFQNIFKSHPILVSTAFLLILFAFLLLSDSHNWNDIKDNLISGTSTEILGAIITLLVVQALFDKYNTNLAKKDERSNIINSYKILSIYIKQYETLLFAMINDYGEYEKNTKKYDLHDNFDITQLQYAHNTCLLLTKSANYSNIHFFLKVELELRELIISVLQNIDFNYHNELYQQLYGYVETSIKYDIRQAISQNDNIINVERTKKSSEHFDFIKDLLANHIKEFIKLLKEHKTTPSNIMYPYVVLYQMINIEKEYLCKYIKLVETLEY